MALTFEDIDIGTKSRPAFSEIAGTLNTVKNFHVVSKRANHSLVGPYLPISKGKVSLRAMPTNVGVVWVSRSNPATEENAFPLQSGDFTEIECDNLNEVFLKFSAHSDRLIVFL